MNERYINEDTVNSPCFYPIRNVWGVKLGDRKFEFASKRKALDFGLKYRNNLLKIPKICLYEVECVIEDKFIGNYWDSSVRRDISMLMGDYYNK